MSQSIKDRVYSIIYRSPVRGNTTAKVAAKLTKELAREGVNPPPYHSIRARLYELLNEGYVVRDDSYSPARYF
jgi:hypothetical protein